ncbi:MAG: peptidoglycan-binding protein [Candidatus Contendobacter odensis]|uniref:Peptidoglycan-binding protein n=1 Tax=Candidatus Contendibacter odensensis TaxID=1400860 RepID=A0A2G6PGE6_9GAMM|nr:MAG: peptidoglycan-binding protein [Candidatus Contendobacter odensis]
MGFIVAMSRQIIFSIWVCVLLGACTFNSVPVIAQNDAVTAASLLQGGGLPLAVQHQRTPPSVQESEASDPAETQAQEEQAAEVAEEPPLLPFCPENVFDLAGQVAIQICQQIRSDPLPTRLKVRGQSLRSLKALVPFYAQRGYQPAWLDSRGQPSPLAEQLLAALDRAGEEGLSKADYSPVQLRALLVDLPADARMLSEYDLIFTDTFLTYGSHLLSGRFLPGKVDPDWTIKPRSRDLGEVLEGALVSGRVVDALLDLAPKNPGYTQLRGLLQQYRQIEKEGGWRTIARGSTLRRGSKGARVQALRARLRASGDLEEEGTTFDKAVTAAVRRFQKRHGLRVNGIVNVSTRKALNMPVAERIRQIELNLERWRWLPDGFGSRYILVNIPNFKMNVFEDGKPVFESKVVVGRKDRQTPTLNADMEYLVLSPKWYVPRSIAVKDKLPKLKRNPHALSRQGIKIYNSAGKQINPSSVNWKSVNAKNFKYYLRQDSGPRNALGGVKFMFPNPHSIYLHDTPSKRLFRRSQRTFSSGCVRVSRPLELAEYLLKDNRRWNRRKIKAAFKARKQQVVHLQEGLPVYLLYWTVWIDSDGVANFRKDIYKRDKPLLRAMRKIHRSGV